MKQVLLVILVGLTSMLMSCVAPSHERTPVTRQTRTVWSSHFVFPNKPNVISLYITNIFFDQMEHFDMFFSCCEDSVDISVMRKYYWFDPPPQSITEARQKVPYPCSKFNEFVNRLASSKSEKCVSRSTSTFFMDETNTLRFISSDWGLCLFDHDENVWSPLDSAFSALGNSDAGVGKWKDRLRPLKIVDKPSSEDSSGRSAPKYFDKRLTDKSQIFLLELDTTTTFIENIDAFPYFRAFIEGDSIVYEFSENGKILKSTKDADFPTFEVMRESLRNYKTETWEVSLSCKDGFSSFHWNDENSLNAIFFYCETEKQAVWSLRKKIEGWFKLKLNMLEEIEMNPDDSKKEPGN